MTAPREFRSVASALISLLAGSVESQEPDRLPVVSFTGGIGNTRQRALVLLGLGYTWIGKK
jgi:hypothetical protein